MPAEVVPAAAIPLLPAAIAEAERRLEPADKRVIAVEMLKLWDYAEAFEQWKRPPGQQHVENMTRYYDEALGDLPADLVARAFQRVRAEHSWNSGLPLPGAVRQQVAAEMASRRRLLGRLEMAKRAADRQAGPPASTKPLTPEQVAQLEAAKRIREEACRAAAASAPGPSPRCAALGNTVAQVLAEAKSFKLVDLSDERVAEIMGESV